MRANHEPTWVTIQTGKGDIDVHVEPGQFIYGRDSAAKELRMKSSSVRNRMEKLKNMQNLDIQADSQYSIITIANWDTYQPKKEEIGQLKGQPEDNQRTTKGQPKDTEKNDKNDKNDKKRKTYSADFERFWDAYPSKTGKKPAWEKWQKLNSRRPDIDVLLAAIEKQKQSRKWREGYIANPATWLHQERWNDMPLETNPLQGVVSDKTMRTIENLRDLELT